MTEEQRTPIIHEGDEFHIKVILPTFWISVGSLALVAIATLKLVEVLS